MSFISNYVLYELLNGEANLTSVDALVYFLVGIFLFTLIIGSIIQARKDVYKHLQLTPLKTEKNSQK